MLAACIADVDSAAPGPEEGNEEAADRGTSGCSSDKHTCALLGVIAFTEKTGDRYNLLWDDTKFSSYARHPNKSTCRPDGGCSTAAGRYRLLKKTWDAITEGDDFSPASQDTAAITLMLMRGVTDFKAIDTRAELEEAINKLGPEWASLPGSPYGTAKVTMDEVWAEFERLRK